MGKQLTPEQVDALLDLLSRDDDYRKLFTSNLGDALQRLPGAPGIPDGLTAGGCLMPVKLADKAAIAQSRAKMRDGLTSRQPHIPKILEAE